MDEMELNELDVVRVGDRVRVLADVVRLLSEELLRLTRELESFDSRRYWTRRSEVVVERKAEVVVLPEPEVVVLTPEQEGWLTRIP